MTVRIPADTNEVTDTDGCRWYRDENAIDAWYCQGFEGIGAVTEAQMVDQFGPLTPVEIPA